MAQKDVRLLSRRGFIPRVFLSSAFRYTLLYLIVFVLTFTVIGSIVFQSTLVATMKRIDGELQSELEYLAEINGRQGSDGWAGVTAVINEVGRLKLVRREALYMVLIGPPYFEMVNDLKEMPEEAVGAEGMFAFEYEARVLDTETGRIETERRPAVGRVGTILYGGPEGREARAIILTARDTGNIRDIREAAQSIAVRVMIFAPFLGLVLGALFSGAFLRRVDRIGQTVKAISDGDLTRRVSILGSGDEFDQLSENINGMLDQIERLMTGMRQVSDNIAHDLRSPLTRIKARLDAALNAPEADYEEIIDQTSTDVERLLATFNALLSITRLESGEGGGASTPVDIAAVAEEMADLYEPAAADEGFELVANIAPVAPIRGSRELISQAIANLLDNAFKYGRHDAAAHIEPKIELTISPRPDGGVLLSVMDNGPGVSEADRERILQRFVRLESSRSTQGNGLGLSLVAAIARRHKAQMSVGRGLAHHPDRRALGRNSDFGLAVRIAFPPPAKPQKKSLAAAAEKNTSSQS